MIETSIKSITGSTKIITLLEAFPDGRASRLMTALGWECTYCSARVHEPVSLAAKRHGNPVKPVLECFRSLDKGEPDSELVIKANIKKKNIGSKWQQHTRKLT